MIATTLLPPSFLTAISKMSWPLGSDSSPPLYFESLEDLKVIRQEQASSDEPPDFLKDLSGTVERLFPPSSAEELERRHYGLISLALILLGNGYTDECHNLVTPLSWPEDIHFAYGPSVYSQVGSMARTMATYVHHLVHRREAFNVGEFGMVGFQNGNYWASAFRSSPGWSQFPHEELGQMVQTRSQQGDFEKSASVQRWCQRHLVVGEGKTSVTYDPRAVQELCATVLQQHEGEDPSLRAFAELVAELELRHLLLHTLPRAGFSVQRKSILATDSSTNTPTELIEGMAFALDPEVGLAASRKLSSAHLANFQTDGSVVVRRVLTELNIATAKAAAAGLACRAMGWQSCAQANNMQEAEVKIIVNSSEQATVVKGTDLELAFGDAFITQKHDCLGGDNCFCFVAGGSINKRAIFVDPLFDGRGETPTTVVQWSKGTIH